MEIINIFYQVGIFILFFSISLPFINTKYNNNLSYVDKLVFNTIIQINLILFLSFLNITLKSILTIYIIYLIIFSFFLIKKIKNIKSIFIKSNYHYFFLFIVCLILCFDVSYSLTLGWDAEKFWFSKALNFYNNDTINNLSNLNNPQYPFMGSLLWAAFWKISFFPEEYFGRLFFVFLYCLSLFSLVETLKLSNISKTIFFTILVLLSYNYDYFDGTQDILIFCLISLAAKIIFEIVSNSRKNLYLYQTILLLLVCNSLIWSKQEGSVYAFIIIFTLIIFSKIYLNEKILLFVSVVFLFIARIFIYKYYNFDVSFNSCCWNDLSASALIEKASINRSALIFKFFFFSFLKNYFFIFGLIFFIIILFSKELLKKYMFIYFFYLMSYGFIFAAYISTDANLTFMLKTGMDRLIFNASPLYILIVTKYINSHKLNF